MAAPADGSNFAVRVTFGHRDTASRSWDGTLEAEGGRIVRAEGWRIWENDGDAILSPTSWRLRSRLERRYGGIDPSRPPPLQYWAEPAGEPSPSGIYFFGDGDNTTVLRFRTRGGDFSVRLADLPWGGVASALGGEVELSRVAAPARISAEAGESDFPSVAVAADGTVWTAWQSYIGGRDEIHLAKHAAARWLTYTPLPGVSGDVWRPQVAIDKEGVVWVVWSQQVGDNWDLYAIAHRGDRFDAPVRLSDAAGADINARVATDAAGRVFVVWQGTADRFSRIYLRYLEAGNWSERFEISPPDEQANHWEPAIAADRRGAVHIAWDTYRDGNYDVHMRSFTPPAKLGVEIPVAVSARYEAHAAVACDRRNRVWVAWESGPVNWGKDLATAVPGQGPGTALGDEMEVKVRVFDGTNSFAPADPQLAFSPNERSRSRYPELAIDAEDRPWLAFRHITLKGRTEHYTTTRGRGHWASYVSCYSGGTWTRAEMLPESVGRISSFAPLAAMPGGGMWAVWNGDGRPWLDQEDPGHNRVFAAFLPGPAAAAETLQPWREPGPVESIAKDREARDVARMRAYRADAGGRTYRIVRGDLHRHAEFSRDQGGGRDGSVLDFYRYMLDAAAMDFGAITEHSNGFNAYWDWLLQKTCDLFQRPGYTTLYAYERTATYPFGHRNIIHARRGVPLVDFFTRPDFAGERPSVQVEAADLLANDTTLLHKRLLETGGISIPHTTATGHGTDWTQYDPRVEPVVEIYQGLRNSYERLDAPRAVKPGKDFHAPGLVSNAYGKGHRLGVIASSDHVSTHVSYAMVFTESIGREDILNAVRQRHTYGATDNIVLDCRIGGHLMGDEFDWEGPVPLEVKAQGTAAVARIVIVKNNAVVYSVEPATDSVALTYRDAGGGSGRSFYYVRLEQTDGQLAWSSPFWVVRR
jgi:hypothetical protein